MVDEFAETVQFVIFREPPTLMAPPKLPLLPVKVQFVKVPMFPKMPPPADRGEAETPLQLVTVQSLMVRVPLL